ncbi:MAG: hypothetical protein PVF49_06370 [Anaerolineales bacterium]|jgi:hypothetical protein
MGIAVVVTGLYGHYRSKGRRRLPFEADLHNRPIVGSDASSMAARGLLAIEQAGVNPAGAE